MMEERLQVYVDPEKAVFSGIEGETIVLTLQNPFAETILYQVRLESEHEFEIDRPRGEINPLHRMDLMIRLLKPDVDLLNCTEKMVIQIWRKQSREKRTRRITVLVRGTSSELTRRKRPQVTYDEQAAANSEHVIAREEVTSPHSDDFKDVIDPELEDKKCQAGTLSSCDFRWIACSLMVGLAICFALFMLPSDSALAGDEKATSAAFLYAQMCHYRVPLAWLVGTTAGFVTGIHAWKWKNMSTS